MCDVLSGGPGMCDKVWQGGGGVKIWPKIAWRTLWTAPSVYYHQNGPTVGQASKATVGLIAALAIWEKLEYYAHFAQHVNSSVCKIRTLYDNNSSLLKKNRLNESTFLSIQMKQLVLWHLTKRCDEFDPVMGKTVFKTILRIENKIVCNNILKMVFQNSFQNTFEKSTV